MDKMKKTAAKVLEEQQVRITAAIQLVMLGAAFVFAAKGEVKKIAKQKKKKIK